MKSRKHRLIVYMSRAAMEHTINELRADESYKYFRYEATGLGFGQTKTISLHFGKEMIAIFELTEDSEMNTQVFARFGRGELALSFARDWYAVLRKKGNAKPPKWLVQEASLIPTLVETTTPAAQTLSPASFESRPSVIETPKIDQQVKCTVVHYAVTQRQAKQEMAAQLAGTTDKTYRKYRNATWLLNEQEFFSITDKTIAEYWKEIAGR